MALKSDDPQVVVSRGKFRIDGEQVRGYDRADFELVWERYCAPINAGHTKSADLDVLDVSASLATNSEPLKAGHLMSPERRTNSSCPTPTFQYPTTYRQWDMCDIKNEKKAVV